MTDRDGDRVAAFALRAYHWVDARLTRWGMTGRFGRDAVLAVLVAIGTQAIFLTVLRFPPDDSLAKLSTTQSEWIVGAVGVQALVLCLRRIRPMLCLVMVVCCQLIVVAAAPELTIRGVAPILAAYAIGSVASFRAILTVTVVAALAEGVVGLAVVARHPVDAFLVGANHLVSGAVVYAVGAFVGVYVATRRRYLRMAQERAADAVRAQQARVRAAISAERSQLSRELHDVAAHHLSSMVIQAAAVERLIDRDPQAAREGAAWLRRQGKETLDNLRLVVGLLRSRDHQAEDENAPVPGLGAVEELVQTARDLGAEVEFVTEGEARQLPPIADISLYRVAQQALTNARQHAPGAPVRLVLEYADRGVALTIVNGRPAKPTEADAASGGGTGLAGMRERADLVGAEFAAGATNEGGWRVAISLPMSHPERAETVDDVAAKGGSVA